MYIGFGNQRGIRIGDEDAFEYAVAHLDCIPREEIVRLAAMLRDGLTAAELTEWYFSGSFIYETAAG